MSDVSFLKCLDSADNQFSEAGMSLDFIIVIHSLWAAFTPNDIASFCLLINNGFDGTNVTYMRLSFR